MSTPTPNITASIRLFQLGVLGVVTGGALCFMGIVGYVIEQQSEKRRKRTNYNKNKKTSNYR